MNVFLDLSEFIHYTFRLFDISIHLAVSQLHMLEEYCIHLLTRSRPIFIKE